MASIGSLNLKLVANPEALVAGLEAARRKVQTFVGTSLIQFKRMANLPGMIEDIFSQTVGSILEADSVFSRIDSIAKLADRFDSSTEAMVGFQKAADLSGVKVEELNAAFEGLQSILGGAQMAGQKTGTSLEKFGLNTKELSEGKLEDAILKIAEAYKRLPPGIDRSTLAIAAFGGAGLKVQKFLENGAEGLAAIRKHAEEAGLSFSRIDAAGIEAARDAVTMLKDVFEGIKRQVAVQIAPVITLLAKKLNEFIKNGPGVAKIIESIANVIFDIVEAVVKGVQQAVRMLEKVIKKTPQRAAPAAKGGAFAGQALLGLISGDSTQIFRGIHGLQGVRDELQAIDDQAGETDAAFSSFLGELAKFKAGLKDALNQKPEGIGFVALVTDITKATDAIAEGINNFGKSQFELQLEAFKTRGATDEMLSSLIAFNDKLEQMKGFAEMEKQAESLRESLKSPFEKFGEELDNNLRLLDANLISLEEFEALAQKSASAFGGGARVASPQALLRGSSAAFSAVNAAQREVAKNPNAKLEAALEKANANDAVMIRELRRIADNLDLGGEFNDILPP